ncbi:MAG: hypothetical protein B7Z10_03175 [Rhodobacterales bacterium 32-66-7]|nr:MAG: hypothetical protein B7Z10_03175 [Rhodobacterales bacterium 32-66-7]
MTQAFFLSALLALAISPGVAGPAKAQALDTEALQPPQTVLVEAPASTPAPTLDKVAFLTALARIEADVKLGVLFVHDGADDKAVVHFAAPRAETIPVIAETLHSLGLVDFEARFADLEAASGDDAVKAAVKQALRELSKARLKVRPTAQQKIQSIEAQLVAAAALFNPDGLTEVADFQDAWGIVMVARDQIDLFARGKDSTLLGRTPDPALITGAQDLGALVDNVMIDLPDPAIPVPVPFDPASITALIEELAVLAG